MLPNCTAQTVKAYSRLYLTRLQASGLPTLFQSPGKEMLAENVSYRKGQQKSPPATATGGPFTIT
jgi:hypothetical protein